MTKDELDEWINEAKFIDSTEEYVPISDLDKGNFISITNDKQNTD